MERKNVFDETVKTLISDASRLTTRYDKLVSNGDNRDAIDTLRLLKDTLALIKEYDWKLEYSEYETSENKQIAVWEQNHSGNIRNHKVWNVTDKKNKSDNKWEDLLRTFIENNQSMIFELSYDNDAQKKHRCTGKTPAIEKLAIEYDLPLFTTRFNANDYNKMMNTRQYKDKTSRAYYSYMDFRGMLGRESIILVDEGFADVEMYKDLISSGYTLIGFKSI